MRTLQKLERGEDDGEIPDAPPVFFHDIDYVIQTWLAHKSHHTYPKAGGFNNQCSWLMRDWHSMNLYYARVEKGVFSASVMPEYAENWMGLTNG